MLSLLTIPFSVIPSIILGAIAIKLGLLNMVLAKKEQRTTAFIWGNIGLIFLGFTVIINTVLKHHFI